MNIGDLAIFGGRPTFPEKLYVGRPNIGDRQEILSRINEVFDRQWLTNNGPFVQELERKLCKRLGVRHCIPVCNGTIGLELAIRALDLSGEVIVPSFTFVATAHALQWQGIRPVFCDIDPISHTIDPSRVEDLITDRTSGIIGVHLWGNSCAIEALQAISRRRGLKLLFDAAHAFGCSHNGAMIGNFGDAEVFSFHATKFFNTFEGGAVATNDDGLAQKLRLMKNFGFAGYDNVVYVGTNGKMNEISAAMGVVGLDHLDEVIAINRQNHRQYMADLAELQGFTPVRYGELDQANYQYVVFEVDEQRAGISRDHLLEILHAENVIARRYFFPGCHRMEPYRSLYADVSPPLPATELVAARCLSLPTGTAVSAAEITKICALIRFVVEQGALVSRLLADKRPPTGGSLPELQP